MIAISNPKGVAPPVGRYSHLAVVPPNTHLLYLAGQIGMRPDGSVPSDVNDQFIQALENVLSILTSEGCGPQDIVKINTFAVEPLTLEKLASFRQELLGDAKPPSTFVYVPRLAAPEFLVELDVIAARTVRSDA